MGKLLILSIPDHEEHIINKIMDLLRMSQSLSTLHHLHRSLHFPSLVLKFG